MIAAIFAKVSQIVLIKIVIKIVATRRQQILGPKCTKFSLDWGFSPEPSGKAYSAPSDPLAGFKGPTFKGRGKEELDGDEGSPLHFSADLCHGAWEAAAALLQGNEGVVNGRNNRLPKINVA